ncbi:MAG: glycosyltransferase family 2 protein [Planctomycetes bacterium]|nr:glycosyltransferase family 2 protein [Planctomycetota bacterium]
MPATTDEPTRDAPVLSILIVNWNTRDLLLALLGRLFPTPMPCEVIVVDNQSGDDSVAAARAAFPAAIVLAEPKNGGFAYGVNRGLERANGRWVLLLNTDAEASWTEIERFLAAAETHPDAAVFGPCVVDEHGRPQRTTWKRHLPRHALTEALFLDGLFPERAPTTDTEIDCVSGCVFLIRRSMLERIGGLDERFWMYYEEEDFCERVRQAGSHVRWLPAARFVHYGSFSANLAAEKTFLAYFESRLLYHAAWHGRFWTEWVRACLLVGHSIRLVGWCGMALLGRRHRVRQYRKLVGRLLRPGLIGALCRQPRQVPPVRAMATVS